MHFLSYSREEIELNDIGIKMPNDNFIYYYEIVNIQVSNLYKDFPSIVIYLRDRTKLRIYYDNNESQRRLENELNYFIESVLED